MGDGIKIPALFDPRSPGWRRYPIAIDDHADAASFQRPFRLADALQRRHSCCPILTGKT